ncbi:peptidylprolyl isomerase [Flavobacteriaceae bacterium]|nr:peptidylprolyl isomerase [Flavobacteriaceae bacterium]
MYSQILKLRERLINDGFESVRDEFHDGNSIFAEDLGYFSGFKMVYDFENVVYSTNINEVSQPFRTQFGYHVVKVFDKRKTRGEVTIGHIMTSFNKNDALLNSEDRINEIYNLIKQGENFENLAKQFSDDANSAKRGGKLNPFKSGDLGSQSFENAAFALNNMGEISKPFKSDFGWHIIKLYEKKPLEPFETLKHKLEIEVKRDSRSERINTALINKLLNVYHVRYDNSDLSDFISTFEKNLLNENWNLTFNLSQNKVLFKIRQNEYKYTDFVEFLKESEKRNLEKKELDTYVSSEYKAFINEKILSYYKDNLHLENLEFANTIKEFEEGLLLFELMEAKVWNSVKNDSIELMKFYENNKSNYIFKERIDAIIARSSSEKTSEYLQKLWLKNDDIDIIKKELNQNGRQNVLFTKDIVGKDHSIIPEGFNFKKGVSNVYYHNDAYYVIKVNKILPKRTKTFNEARGIVVSAFQAQKEVSLIDSLAKKYKIKINNNVLNNIKTQLLSH